MYHGIIRNLRAHWTKLCILYNCFFAYQNIIMLVSQLAQVFWFVYRQIFCIKKIYYIVYDDYLVGCPVRRPWVLLNVSYSTREASYI